MRWQGVGSREWEEHRDVGLSVAVDIPECADGLPRFNDLFRAISASTRDQWFEPQTRICGVKWGFKHNRGTVGFRRGAWRGRCRRGGGGFGSRFRGRAAAATGHAQGQAHNQGGCGYCTRCR